MSINITGTAPGLAESSGSAALPHTIVCTQTLVRYRRRLDDTMNIWQNLFCSITMQFHLTCYLPMQPDANIIATELNLLSSDVLLNVLVQTEMQRSSQRLAVRVGLQEHQQLPPRTLCRLPQVPLRNRQVH